MVLNPTRRSGSIWLILALVGVGCGDDPEPPVAAHHAAPAAFRAESLTVEVPLAFPAQVYVERDAVVAARSAGIVESLFVDIGATVEAGTRLAQIESADQALALARAEAAREQAARVLTRARALRDADGMSSAEAEAMEFAFRTADLEARRARRDLDLTRIEAPFAGRVTARYVQPSRLVAVGDTLFRVAEAAPLLARIRVPVSAARRLRPGSAVTVAADSLSQGSGSVLTVAPAIDPGSGTREVIVRLAGTGLMPGAAVTVRIGAAPRRVLAIPRTALSADGFVLVQNGDRPVLRTVVLGEDLGDGLVEVLSGVRAGEQLARPER